MDKKAIFKNLQKLKELQIDRNQVVRFNTKGDVSDWADQVLPRLKFNRDIYLDFTKCLNNGFSDSLHGGFGRLFSSNFPYYIRSPFNRETFFDQLSGIINRAIAELEAEKELIEDTEQPIKKTKDYKFNPTTKPGKLGRRPEYDPFRDKRLLDGWTSCRKAGIYKKIAEFAEAKGLPENEMKLALDRAKKRERRLR